MITPEQKIIRDTAGTVDIRIRDEGTIVLFWPVSDLGSSWILENVAVETTWGSAVVVEHHYAQDIINGARADGLVFGGR